MGSNSTHTTLSPPGCVATTRARGHLVGIVPLSCRMTTSPTATVLEGNRHLLYFFSLQRYSLHQHSQKWQTRFWQRCQRLSRDTDLQESWGSGSDVRGLPIKKWPGVSAAMHAIIIRRVHGWEKETVHTHFDLSQHSKVSFTGDTTHFKWNLALFTVDSQIPPKWGDLSGMYFHWMLCELQNSDTTPWVM